MKSNGHLDAIITSSLKCVPNKVPIVESSTSIEHQRIVLKTSNNTISTDPNELVKQITKSLKQPIIEPTMEIMSSGEEDSDVDSDGNRNVPQPDVNSPDVAVIEDEELNLEDLMMQKALLQARLGTILSDGSDGDDVTVTSARKQRKALAMAANAANATTKRHVNTVESQPMEPAKKSEADVILLDDSSGEVIEKRMSSSRKFGATSSATAVGQHKDRNTSVRDDRRRSRSRTDDRDRGKFTARRGGAADSGRSGTVAAGDNRHKEDLRVEIDRDQRYDRGAQQQQQQQQRDHRDRPDGRDGRDHRMQMDGGRRMDNRRGGAGGFATGMRNERAGGGRSPLERDNNRGGFGRNRERSRSRDRGIGRGRSRDRYDSHRYGNDDRNGARRRDNIDGSNKRGDRFVGSLSEGQKPDRESSSDDETAHRHGDRRRGHGHDKKISYTIEDSNDNESNDDDEDDDDEEKIIEMRRKKREELLQKLAVTATIVNPTQTELLSSEDVDNVTVKKRKIHADDGADDDVLLVTETAARESTNGKQRLSIGDVDKQVTVVKPLAAEQQPDDDSTTPPLPPGLCGIPGESQPTPLDACKEDENFKDKDKDKSERGKEKKNDWDMFAEQDIDSNFDVSIELNEILTFSYGTYICNNHQKRDRVPTPSLPTNTPTTIPP